MQWNFLQGVGFLLPNSMGATIIYGTGNAISSGDAALQATGINMAQQCTTNTLTNNTISSGSALPASGINKCIFP